MCRDRITGNAICIARRSALGYENQGMIYSSLFTDYARLQMLMDLLFPFWGGEEAPHKTSSTFTS